jgi:riboflavin synthase
VGGICLTAEGIRAPRLEFRMTRETLERTSFRRLRSGSEVNVERSLVLGDRIGGHLVLGHVDGTARVVRVTADPNDWRVRFRVDSGLRWALVPKASIAVDGVSLTVVEPEGLEFSVALVEFTLDGTTLRSLREGDEVNVEGDVLGRWVAHLLRMGEGTVGREPLGWDRLRELGRFGAGPGTPGR